LGSYTARVRKKPNAVRKKLRQSKTKHTLPHLFKEKVIAKYSMTSKHNNTQWKNCQEATAYLEGFSKIM
jgi:hypothetical protein